MCLQLSAVDLIVLVASGGLVGAFFFAIILAIISVIPTKETKNGQTW